MEGQNIQQIISEVLLLVFSILTFAKNTVKLDANLMGQSISLNILPEMPIHVTYELWVLFGIVLFSSIYYNLKIKTAE